jgi:hypothetical protein
MEPLGQRLTAADVISERFLSNSLARIILVILIIAGLQGSAADPSHVGCTIPSVSHSTSEITIQRPCPS